MVERFNTRHQRTASSDPFRQQGRSGSDLDELFEAVQTPHPAACTRRKNSHPRTQGMAAEAARITRQTRLRSNGTGQVASLALQTQLNDARILML